MTDIVERLAGTFRAEPAAQRVMDEDTDLITALRAENEKLRAALEKIVKPGGADSIWECVEIARAALKGETNGN